MSTMLLLAILGGILLLGGLLTYVLFKKYKSAVVDTCSDSSCSSSTSAVSCQGDVCTRPVQEVVEPLQEQSVSSEQVDESNQSNLTDN